MRHPLRARRPYLVAVVGLVVGTACESPSPSPAPVAVTRNPLEVTLSAPFDLGPTPPLVAGSNVASVAMACGSTRCFAGFRQTLPGLRPANYGSRIGADGVPTDVPLLDLNAAGTPTKVGARGDEFLVANQISTSSTATVYDLERIRGADGTRVGQVVNVTLPYPLLAIAGSGPGWLLLSGTSSNIQAQVYDANLAPLAAPIKIVYDSSQAKLIAGEDQFLVVVAGTAQRISASTGLALDAAPLQYAKYNAAVSQGAYVNGIYFLTWARDYNFYGSRIRASTGELLDPDDDFNQKTGAKVLCAGCAAESWGSGNLYAAAAIDGKAVLLWKPNFGDTTSMYAAGVDVSTGLRVDGMTTSPAAIGSIPGVPAMACYGLGGAGMLEVENSVYPIGFASGGVTLTAQPPVPIARERESRVGPVVTSNGSGYLVVYGSGKNLFATRIDPETGAYLDDPPLLLANNAVSGAYVAAMGSDYLVVWIINVNGVLGRALVHADGTVTALTTYKPPAIAPSVLLNVQVAANGTYFLLAWRYTIYLQGIRLMPDGVTQVDATPINFDTTLGNLATAFTPVGDTTPTPDRKSFLLFYRPTTDLVVRRFRSQSGSVITPLTTIAAGVVNQTDNTAATDGTQFMATWVLNNGNETWQAAYVDPVSGTAVANSLTTLMDLGTSRSLGPSWWDGRSWNQVILEVNADAGTIGAYLQRLDTKLQRLDANLAGLGTVLVERGRSRSHDAASAGNGRSLLVYQTADSQYLGTYIKGRFIDNDGAPAQPGSDAGTAGASGTGGSGGLGGTAGGMTSSGGTTGGTSTTGGAAIGGQATGGVATGGVATGGLTSTGGVTSSGGSGAGGAVVGGSDNAGGGAGGSGGGSDGCTCKVASRGTSGQGAPAWFAFWGVGVVGLLGSRRRRG